ncbi:MAG: YcgN family cysteine cluster protein [Desulfobacteraceae bacterium]|jgi:uncharacterized cysteine cluster protein YcgN (CxxCxxCC family)
MKEALFWKSKSLKEMSRTEWEFLCDGCAICCLEKVADGKTGTIKLTSVACEFLDTTTCRCSIYELRTIANPSCTKITPKNVKQIGWLPRTCAYRSLAEDRDLEWWHPLVSGDPDTVHEAGISIRNKVVSGAFVHPDDLS